MNAPPQSVVPGAFSVVVVIPVFNHGQAIGRMVAGVRAQQLPGLLVDDGSEPGCAAILANLAAAEDGQVRLIRLPSNQGKGAAVIAGLREAGRLGYTHAVQIDADGQHQVNDIAGFVAEARAFPDAVIIGTPAFDRSVPRGRLVGRYLTHLWVWINTLSFAIGDSMCGFRVYPLPPILALLDTVQIGRRMDFDIEILVRLHWRGLKIRNRRTPVIYPPDGVSHFSFWRDNLSISRLHTKLFFGMLWRLPLLLWRKLRA
ncbi:MAG: glycosyl transferase [Lysobacterales bacterium CG02_land_8_20_14_3_00_62_12]|nr:MAG: glycosyl transferase [Xanthomonadales bacterium CG02_land_8_20_14_3_00_62_12]PJA37287.1 MAG: glycosyl transferase [Xanthomonadales bacterium CG_4_9_14_3_um_filter_62_6]